MTSSLGRGCLGVPGVVLGEAGLQLWSEVSDETLGWPSGAVSKGANGVAFNLKEGKSF